jgi:hypothetical protein
MTMKKLSISVMLAVPVAVALIGGNTWANADTGSDRFNREVRWAHLALQRGDIVTESGSGPSAAQGGAAGRRIEAQYGQGPSLDSGSRWFNDYVDQVNAQLRLKENADSALP